jgi:uncharacterized protein (TIGR03435 family)
MAFLRIVFGVVVSAVLGLAQNAAPLQFEVASVKAAPSGGGRGGMRGGPGTSDPERMTIESMPLRRILMTAYGVEIDQISGPAWIDSEKYSVSAKIPPGTTEEQFQTMLQNLLIQRLKLVLHHEIRSFSGYELVVAKGGPKLIPAASRDPNDTAPDHPISDVPTPTKMEMDKEGCPVARPGVSSGMGRFGPGVTCSRFTNTSMPEFAKSLEPFVSMEEGSLFGAGAAHVIDRTGLEGNFDITLKFHVSMRFPGQAAQTEPDMGDGPTLYQALEQQLGLKLQKAKPQMDVIIIDQGDRVPVEN